MILGKINATNFGSYTNLEYDFHNQGLCLIYGPTGTGKSTIADTVMWCLFGETAKNGVSDDVRPWGIKEPTTVSLEVFNPNTEPLYTVHRTRGLSKENDLYWIEHFVGYQTVMRGKDITDTQKLLNERLGIDADTFQAGSYFHEFSSTANFFTAKAKDRRQLFEKLANLDLPKKLSDAITIKRKEIKYGIERAEKRKEHYIGQLQATKSGREATTIHLKEWDRKQEGIIKRLKELSEGYESKQKEEVVKWEDAYYKWEETNRKAIDSYQTQLKEIQSILDNYPGWKDSCVVCGQSIPLGEPLKKMYTRRSDVTTALNLQVRKINPNIKPLNGGNPYPDQVERAINAENPFKAVLLQADYNLKSIDENLDKVKDSLYALDVDLTDFNALYDLTYTLRSELLKSAINSLQRHTNELLSTYFDAAITVNLSLESLDSVEVTIAKDGNTCNYKQLSRGQRALLRLCFVVAVMSQVSDSTSINFNTIFLDEVLDGMDASLKSRAFKLFESLEAQYSTILLIDHAEEFQNLFSHKYRVEIVAGHSVLNEES